MSATDTRRAVAHLKRHDPVMARVIERIGPCRLVPRANGTHFDALVRAIIYQQLSGRAAATIHSRVEALFGGRPPTPDELIAMPETSLRAAGLSRQKLGYLGDLARRTASGEVPLERIEGLDDDAIIDALTQVKGIGRWSAQMFLLFRLGRPNVLPDLDLGVRKAIRIEYRKRKMPTAEQVRRIGKVWEPYCSVAAWYLWRSLDQ